MLTTSDEDQPAAGVVGYPLSIASDTRNLLEQAPAGQLAPREARHFRRPGPGHAGISTGELRFVLVLWLASRAFVLACLWLWSEDPLAAVRNWDAGWFLELARTGYVQPYQAAFFPGFPSVVAATETLTGNLTTAALAANAILSLTVAALLYAVARLHLDVRASRIALAVVLFHPLSFFLSIPYSEALFLVAILGMFLAAERSRLLVAAVFAAAATLTRNTGILLVLPLACFAWMQLRSQRPGGTPTRVAKGLLVAAVPLLALAGYMAFTWLRFGDPLLFFRSQSHWQDHIALGPPFAALLRDLGRWRAWVDHHLLFSLAGIYLSWRVLRRWPTPYGLLVLPAAGLSFCLTKLAITPRLHLVLFPLWLEAGSLLAGKPRWLRLLALVAALAWGAGLIFRFAAGQWVD